MYSTSEPREQAVPKYFRKTPPKPKTGGLIIGIVVGILLLFIGLASKDGTCGIALGVMIGGGAAWAYASTMSSYNREYAKAEPKPTDEQMDAWLNGDIQRIKQEAIQKLDLSYEQLITEPIVVIGPAKNAVWAIGKDLTIRFSSYDIVVIYLTEHQLAAYQCELDLASASRRKETTKEYHYRDVVSVSTQVDNTNWIAVMIDGSQKEIASFQKFSLSVASGERIEVAVDFPQLQNIFKEGRFTSTGAEKAIHVIRKTLREKKGAEQ